MRSTLHENMRLAPTARTLWEIQENSCRIPVETATNIHYEVLRRQAEYQRVSQARRDAVSDAAALSHYQAQCREDFLQCLGGLPQGTAGPLSRLMDVVDCGDLSIEKVMLQPRPGTFATTNVYVPARHTAPCPAVLMTVGHDDRGKADPEYQYAAQLLAHAGFVVLVLDPIGQGERFEHYEPSIDLQPIQGCSGEHDLLHWKGMLMGLPLARYFLHDGLCALAYLAAREDVDASRIAITGHSGGGTQCTMLMLMAGDRLAAAAPCSYITDNRAMMEYGIDPDNEMIWPGSIAKGLDYVDQTAGMAPKPVLFLTTAHDFFPREGTLRTLEEARRLWAAVGSPHVPQIATAQSQHGFPRSLAGAMVQFFSTLLLGHKAQEEGFVFRLQTETTLWCTRSGSLLKDFPQMRTVQDEFLASAALCASRRRGMTADALRLWLQEALHSSRAATSPHVRVFREGICGHCLYRSVMWRSEEGIWDAGVFLRDMRMGDQPLPTLIALWPEGMARLTDHSHWIHTVLARGYQVLVLDVAASGALMPAGLGTADMYIGWSVMYNLSAYLMQMGDSLLGLRTRQVISAVHMVRHWPEASPDIRLFGRGEFSRYADLAALLTATPVCSDEHYQSYDAIVRTRYHDQTHTHAWVFPGVLRHMDTSDLRRFLAGESLLCPDPGQNESACALT